MTSARGPGNGVGRVVQPSLTPIIEVADHSGVHGMRWGGRAEELQRMLDHVAPARRRHITQHRTTSMLQPMSDCICTSGPSGIQRSS